MSSFFNSFVEPVPTDKGYLELHVKNNQGKDLQGVLVEIIRERDNALINEINTNENGQIRVPLDTPPAGYGIKGMQYVVPYTVYKIRLDYEGKIVILNRLAVYANLTTIQYCVI